MVESQQLTTPPPDPLVPVQQVVPGLQHVSVFNPSEPVVMHAWPVGQHVPPRHTPEQHWLSSTQLLPPVVQHSPLAGQICVEESQQLTTPPPEELVPVQQVVPGLQQVAVLAPFEPVTAQTWPVGQQVPPRHRPEQQSPSAWQLLPPPVQQEPPVQVCPAWHALPHPPQLPESVLVSTQAPLQQVWPDGQTLPQAPQLPVSVAVFVHVPLHLV